MAARFTLLLYTLSITSTFSQSPDVEFNTGTPYITGLTSAMQLVHAGDGSNRIFVAERAGVIKIFKPGALTTPIVFLNMNSGGQVVFPAGEGGLLSIAFHPDFATNGYFYTFYTNDLRDLVVARYTATTPSGDVALASTRVQILAIDHRANTNHNGGEMHFGVDNYLYISTGDGGSGNDPPNNAQNPAVLLGKLLRIDVDVPETAEKKYAIPSTNPNPASEIYASGLRNPFRWSFDKLTNAIWIGDVGQSAREEVNYVPASDLSGANFGWRCFEGEIIAPGLPSGSICPERDACTFPVYTYQTGAARGQSVIGGIVYRGTRWPLMYGYYIGTDVYSGQIHKIRSDGTPENFETSNLTGVVDIGEDEAGEIYAVTGASIYTITASVALPVTLINFSGSKGIEGVKLSWETSTEENSRSFEVEHSMDAVRFENIGTVPSDNSISGAKYHFSHTNKVAGINYYRLKMVDADDAFEYSKIIAVDTGLEEIAENFIRPSLITDNVMNLVLDQPFQFVELVGASGQVFLKEDIGGKKGPVSIPLNTTSSGIYIVRLSDYSKVLQQKVLIME
ncbi:PQQ-dependent sugar dehydrogenase [Dyadobacter arcticus]|uniref:Glucose/arabinose dehydrogenase n=1 Tax=Dyadobacter arcticus TaxID=1078754 RepID=A0ABX0URA3_9BACT|nr:PQQ-dependent sugar dehydrogenase [Dyadobacter arcticus]NIJ55523.1 glucose/arabinose dehydrogenase [Dyadobacter arcticus]